MDDKHLIQETNYCSIYNNRNRCCEVAPFPTDLWFDDKFKNCTIYYFKKPKKEHKK